MALSVRSNSSTSSARRRLYLFRQLALQKAAGRPEVGSPQRFVQDGCTHGNGSYSSESFTMLCPGRLAAGAPLVVAVSIVAAPPWASVLRG